MAEAMRMQRSSRDPHRMQQRLQRWLTTTLAPTLPKGASPTVSDLAGTNANGMSSDTVLFRATWDDADCHHDEQLVARIAPDAVDVPVFPTYDLPGQFEAIRAVAELTEVPVPRAWWCEPSSDPLGAPFFVMSRVDGVVPPDVMPYTFGDNWLFDATLDQQQRLQTRTVEAIAALHDISDAARRLPFLDKERPGNTHLRRHVANTRAWYDMVARAGAPSPLVEQGFAWLDAHWPDHEGPAVLSWGDSRIGNVLYEDFAPAALLDWEMAGLGPCELDVAWITYAHLVFQDIASVLGLPGMPAFMRPADVATQYEALRGYAVRDLRFFMVYAAVQWGIVFLRTGQRQAHFGEREMPADPQELLHNRPHLESLLADIDGI
jgi:aminoglycoside phosphotransferase (APT) family kinase protein